VIHGGSPMLLARAARRRALEESRIADVARDSGAPAEGSESADASSTDRRELALILPGSYGESGGRSDFTVDDRGSDGGNQNDEVSSERISINEVLRLLKSDEPVAVLDVRTERSLETSDSQVEGAVRLPPEHVVPRASELNLPKDAWLIAYCA